MEDVGEKVGRMLNAEASRSRTVKVQDDPIRSRGKNH
jgi:hypothetical protein